MANRRRYAVATVTVAAMLVGLGFAATRPDRQLPADASDPSAAATTTPPAVVTRSPAAPLRPVERTGREASGATGDVDEDAEPSVASEVSDTETTALTGLPGLGRAARDQRAARAELRDDFPALLTREGALVAGHPSRNVPIPPTAVIRSSSLSSQGGIVQVDLVIRVPGSMDRALRYYRTRLSRVGFTESDAPPAVSGAAASFRRGADSMALAAESRGTGTVVSLHATLRTGG